MFRFGGDFPLGRLAWVARRDIYLWQMMVASKKRIAYIVLAAAMAAQTATAQSVSVAELEQRLVRLKGKSDSAAADALTGMDLTERASAARLERWRKQLPGDRSRDALLALVDESAFLKLPAGDLSVAPPPDETAQHEMMARTVGRLNLVFSLLPNFYATRATTHFEDASMQVQQSQPFPTSSGGGRRGAGIMDNFSSITSWEPIHRTGRFEVTISFRDGDEAIETPKGRTSQQAVGLTTSGEFGPILEVVVGDSGRGKIAWDHWEQGPTGTLAVFKFSVTEPESHFRVSLASGNGIDTAHPAYHGEIAIDPASGDVFRLTEVADMTPPHERVQAELLVEYAPVALGERSYICPVRGVAMLKVPTSADPGMQKAGEPALKTYLNDEVFTDYHLFRAETRILPE